MRLGIVGKGPWANIYALTLDKMGIGYPQVSRTYRDLSDVDGVIIATSPDSHAEIAQHFIMDGTPILIEKPVCLDGAAANTLLQMATDYQSIVFTGHTRLYSNAWRAFKAKALAAGVESVYAVAGGQSKLAPLWDWGPHLVAMCIDLGVDPLEAHIVTSSEEMPLKIIVNGDMVYTDQPETPSPLEVLLNEFMDAIALGVEDVRGLKLGVRVVEAIERIEYRAKRERKYGT